MLDTIINYLNQQSTWKGIISIATAAGVTVSPDLSTQIIALGLSVIGVINVLRDEKKVK
jgi:hypothetical protein